MKTLCDGTETLISSVHNRLHKIKIKIPVIALLLLRRYLLRLIHITIRCVYSMELGSEASLKLNFIHTIQSYNCSNMKEIRLYTSVVETVSRRYEWWSVSRIFGLTYFDVPMKKKIVVVLKAINFHTFQDVGLYLQCFQLHAGLRPSISIRKFHQLWSTELRSTYSDIPMFPNIGPLLFYYMQQVRHAVAKRHYISYR
jgi:hypothetical protein